MRVDEYFKNIFDASPVPMVISRADGSIEYVNDALVDMLGYSVEEIKSKDVIISHPEEFITNKKIRKSLADNPLSSIVIEKRYIHKSGKIIEGLLTLAAQPDEDGNVHQFIAQLIDLTHQKEAENSLKLFRTLLQYSNDSIFFIDAKTGKFFDANKQACERLGYTVEELLKMSVPEIECELNDNVSWDSHVDDLRKIQFMMMEGKHRRKDGSTFPVEVSCSYAQVNEIEYIIAVTRDISDRKQSEEIIWHQANFDSLTGLPNRSMLNDRLNKAVINAKRTNRSLSVLALDLDGFKEINDTLGHSAGDQLLVQVANRIKQCVRESDTVSRIGGDEFIVILESIENSTNAGRVISDILDKLQQPFLLNQSKVYVTASIGASICPKDGNCVDTLLQHCDQAMYDAKYSGKNCCHYFDKTIEKRAERNVLLSQELRSALENNQFEVHYQPIINLTTGKIETAEALLRWNHPELGSIPPMEFIPIAETNGTINEIGDWVFASIINLVARCRKIYSPDFKISINVSPTQFRKGKEAFQNWYSLLSNIDKNGSSIIIEITEGTMLDENIDTHAALIKFQEMGMQVALDDFGTGYSSLSYLRQFSIDILKIDRSFVQNMTQDSNDFIMCEAIILMAHKLNLKVIAEGIETKEQADLLIKAGCEYGQGYFYSKPLPAQNLEKYWESR